MADPHKAHTLHEQVRANVVMATLALMTGTPAIGVVRADTAFRVEAPESYFALLEVATAVQTEVSLSIYSSDPLLAEAVKILEKHISDRGEFERQEVAIIETDRILQQWISMISGRGQEMNEVAEWIYKNGEISLADLADRLAISVA